MTDPLLWLVLSLLFVTASLTIALVVAIPALKELARAARSADKLFETLRREFPPTLQAIRTMGIEVSDLTDDVSQGVQNAGNVVKQVDESLTTVRKQAQKVNSSTRSLLVGVKAAWRTFTKPPKTMVARRVPDRLPPGLPRPEINPSSPVPIPEPRISDRPLPETTHVLPPEMGSQPTDQHWTGRNGAGPPIYPPSPGRVELPESDRR
jgi:uncharacterized protein YoxC